jgi:hypothetical protein
MTKIRDIISPGPVCMPPGESVSAAAQAMAIGDLALEKDATSALSGVSAAPPKA